MKAKKSLQTAGAALVLAILAVPVLAQQAPAGQVDPAFQGMDKNHDGRLSRSEIPADMVLMRTRFATYDQNQDGYLDPQEFAAAKLAMQGAGHAMGGQEPAPQPSQPQSHPPGG